MQIILKYINHYFKARGRKGYGIHSPFIFHLVTSVIHDFTPFYCFENIEEQRELLLKNTKTIRVNDLGVGSKKHKSSQRPISAIAKYSLKPAKQAQLLFRLINFYNCQHIIELGTSLGITTSYLASCNTQSKVFSLEGCPEQIKVAKTVFKNLNLNNILTVPGDFSTTLPKALDELKQIDFVFFDGNHSKEANMAYFELCLPYILNHTFFVFDDIHLNDDMEDFWEQIIKRSEITVSLDLFWLGIVFFRKESSKEHFKIRF